MSNILCLCALLSCMDWRRATVDQIDGEFALIEVEGLSLLTVALSCLPPTSGEGDVLLFASTNSSVCPIVLIGEIDPREVNRSSRSKLERSQW